MDLTRDGGWIAGGYSYSNRSGEKSQNSRGIDDYWIIKFDKTGKIQWDKTIGGNSLDELSSVRQTKDGGYILAGYSLSDISGEKSEPHKGDVDYYADFWIVKLDANGNKTWDKTIGGFGDENPPTAEQTSDGGYIVGGSSESNISGDKTENSRGALDYWVVKLDANGNKLWDKTFGGSDYDFLQTIHQTKDGGYILGGYSRSPKSGEKTGQRRGAEGFEDYWIVKLNNAGTKQWDRTFGGTYDDYLADLKQTADGGYILGGTSWSDISGEKTQNSIGLDDYWIVKVNANGHKQWDKTIGGGAIEDFEAILQTRDGGYLLGGYSGSGISGNKTEKNRKSRDYWVVKTDKTGNFVWDKTIGGFNEDGIMDMKETKINEYKLAGYSYSGATGDKTGTNRGGNVFSNDYWIVTLNYTPPMSIATAEVADKSDLLETKNHKLIIYPNPAKDILQIHAGAKVAITVTDQLGKVVLTKNITGNSTLDISKLQAGIYYLKNNTTGEVQRVVIAR
jgi:hypothetical protein